MAPASRKRRAPRALASDVPAASDVTVATGGCAAPDAPPTPGPPTPGPPIPDGPAPSRAEVRNATVRASLIPIGPAERPAPLMVAVGVAVILAVAVMLGALTVHDLSRRGGSLPGAVFLCVALLIAAVGMYRRRYWAVLGFEALLGFQIMVTSLALVVASTLAAAALCLLSIGLSGWLFFRLIRVMARLQVPSPPTPTVEAPSSRP